jgi:hypothetical protein
MLRKLAGLGLLALSMAVAGGVSAQTEALQPQRGFDPTRPEDRAFDPSTQDVPMRAAIQRPRLRLIGVVPITSGLGSNVPILSLEAPALRLTQTQRWVIDLVAANNSSLTITPEIRCTFMNGGKPVEMVTVFLEGLGAGQKVYFNIFGPPGDVYVDLAPCQVMTTGRMP